MPKLFKDRTGEVNKMRTGETCKIIKYNTSYNIDVEFEDGTVVENRTYGDFKNGLIRNKRTAWNYVP